MGLKRFNEFVKSRGRWLMNEQRWDIWLLNKADALEALLILESDQAIVLGGDAFFEHRDGRPTYGVSVGKYDSFWRFERRPDESFEDASKRSKAEARKFIESYPADVEGFVGLEIGAVDFEGYRELILRKREWDDRIRKEFGGP